MADPMSTSNVLNRYLFEDLSVRGELVQMDEAYQQIISSKEYPAPVQKLGELLVSTTLLTATLKLEGSIRCNRTRIPSILAVIGWR